MMGDLPYDGICPNETWYPRSGIWHRETPVSESFKVYYLNFIASRVFDMLACSLRFCYLGRNVGKNMGTMTISCLDEIWGIATSGRLSQF